MSSFRVTTGRDGSRSVYGEHDDRDSRAGGGQSYQGQGGPRRNNRNNQRKRGYGRYRNPRGGRGGPNPRSHLDDDDDGDIDMSNTNPLPRNRYNPYGQHGGQSRSRPGSKLAMDQEPQFVRNRVGSQNRYRTKGRNPMGTSPSGWFKVTIPHGRPAGKDFIFQSINRLIDVPFIPQLFHFEGNAAVFYVEDKFMADSIRSISRRVTSPTGFKIIIMVSPSGPPKLAGTLTDEAVEKLKVSMSNRYEPATKMLKMNDFFNDPDLKKDNIRIALNRPAVMSKVLNIINENIPELVSLDISNNRLMSLDGVKGIATKAPNVTSLILSKNQLKHQSTLENIKDLQLETLYLDGNPLCDRFKDETSYVSTIRKRFPKVINLDGHDLPPPITFDIEQTTTLPPAKGSYFMNDQAKQLVCLFLDQYYAIYDSDNRQQLLEAYHDSAFFSMSVSYNKLNTSKQPSFSSYLRDSRNLVRISRDVFHKMLKQDRLSIVALLKQLPTTDHDPASFKVDVIHASSSLMLFVVHGIFKETNSKSDTPPIRSFSRTFLTVPQGSGIVIMNEQFCITNASHEQVKNAFRTPAPTPSSSPVSAPGGSTPVAIPTDVKPVLTLEQKQQMACQFAVQSGMNLDWSTKCLEENLWDFETAARVFTGLQASGAIPPEAFVK